MMQGVFEWDLGERNPAKVPMQGDNRATHSDFLMCIHSCIHECTYLCILMYAQMYACIHLLREREEGLRAI